MSGSATAAEPATVAASSPARALLPPEDLAIQLGNIETILSVYGGHDAEGQGEDAKESGNDDGNEDDDELIISDTDEAAIRNLARFLALPLVQLGDAESTQIRDSLPAHIVFGLRLDPLRGGEQAEGAAAALPPRRSGAVLEARFALRRPKAEKDANAPARPADGQGHPLWPSWTVQKAPWLSSSQYDNIVRRANEAAQPLLRGGQTPNGDPVPAELDGDDGAGFLLSIAEAITETLLDVHTEGVQATR